MKRQRIRPHVGHYWHGPGAGLNFMLALLDKVTGNSVGGVWLTDNVVTRFDVLPELRPHHEGIVALARKWQRRATPVSVA